MSLFAVSKCCEHLSCEHLSCEPMPGYRSTNSRPIVRCDINVRHYIINAYNFSVQPAKCCKSNCPWLEESARMTAVAVKAWQGPASDRFVSPCISVNVVKGYPDTWATDIWPTDTWPTDIWSTDTWPTDIWPTDTWPTDIWPISAWGDIWPTDKMSHFNNSFIQFNNRIPSRAVSDGNITKMWKESKEKFGQNCLLAKCPPMHLLAKCPLAKCPLAKCPGFPLKPISVYSIYFVCTLMCLHSSPVCTNPILL